MARSAPLASLHPPLLPRHAWRVIAAATAAGLLLFVAVWLASRDELPNQGQPAASTEATGQPEPLPRPLPAGGDGASDMPDAGVPAERPRLVETAPQMPPSMPEDRMANPAGVAPPQAPVPPTPGNLASTTGQPVPLAGSMPSPVYPANALRRREQGTVLVRVEVDRSGRPSGVALVQRSGSRDLDRAAQDAVRQWRFQPAVVDGQAVPGSLEVPVDFRLD